MFDPVTATVAVLAAAGGYQAYETSRQTKEMKKQSRDAVSRAENLAAEEEKNKLQAMMRNQKRRGAVGEPGLRDTILTGSLGVPGGQQATGGKTLLGA